MRRDIVADLVQQRISERLACAVVGLARCSCRYRARASAEGERVRQAVRELARQHPRYGYRRVTALLRREWPINPGRVWRIWHAEHLKACLGQQGTQTVFIDPGHPWQNGYAESFIGKVRVECLNQEVFWGVAHAQVLVEQWPRRYNEDRPHRALGYRTPAEAARAAQVASDRAGGDRTKQGS